MGVIFILIVACLVVAVGFLIAFIWSVRSGQYDDTYTPSVRILFDENDKKEKNTEEKNINKNENNENNENK